MKCSRGFLVFTEAPFTRQPGRRPGELTFFVNLFRGGPGSSGISFKNSKKDAEFCEHFHFRQLRINFSGR